MRNTMLFGDLQETCVKNLSKCVALVFIKWQMIDWFLTTVTNYFKFRTSKSGMGLFTAKKNEHTHICTCLLSAFLNSNMELISIRKFCNILSGSEIINLTALNIYSLFSQISCLYFLSITPKTQIAYSTLFSSCFPYYREHPEKLTLRDIIPKQLDGRQTNISKASTNLFIPTWI